MKLRVLVPAFAGSCLALVLAGCGGSSSSSTNNTDLRPVVYAMSNGASNTIDAWRVNTDGTFASVGQYSTNGAVSPTEVPDTAGPADGIDPLGSQGALSLSDNQQFLLAVNAGSGTVSSFRVGSDGALSLVNTVSSGGTSPVSVSCVGNHVYVANVNDPTGSTPANIAGFSIDSGGNLTAVPGAIYPLSADAARPAQVGISPDGLKVVVTEQGTNAISMWPLHFDGTLGPRVTVASAGTVPFGFDFSNGSAWIVVSEAGTGTTSSYAITTDTPTLIRGSVSTGGTAPCWVTVPGNRSLAIVTNAGSDNLSSFSIDSSGNIFIKDTGIQTGGSGSGPIDSGYGGLQFFQLLGATGQIADYTVNANGTLTFQGVQATGLPTTGTQGLAVLTINPTN